MLTIRCLPFCLFSWSMIGKWLVIFYTGCQEIWGKCVQAKEMDTKQQNCGDDYQSQSGRRKDIINQNKV